MNTLKKIDKNNTTGLSAHSANGPVNGKGALIAESARGSVDAVYERLGTGAEGLTRQEVEERIQRYGRNEIAHERPTPWLVMLRHNFRNPFILVLLILGIVSYGTGDLRGAIVVSVMVAVSVLMRLFQEFRSSRAAEALRAMVRTTSNAP